MKVWRGAIKAMEKGYSILGLGGRDGLDQPKSKRSEWVRAVQRHHEGAQPIHQICEIWIRERDLDPLLEKQMVWLQPTVYGIPQSVWFSEEQTRNSQWASDSNSIFHLVESPTQIESLTQETSFPSKLVLNSRMPSKAAFLLWLIYFGKVQTVDNLMVRGIPLVNRCCMCYQSGKTMNHMFLHYLVAALIWYSGMGRFNRL